MTTHTVSATDKMKSKEKQQTQTQGSDTSICTVNMCLQSWKTQYSLFSKLLHRLQVVLPCMVLSRWVIKSIKALAVTEGILVGSKEGHLIGFVFFSFGNYSYEYVLVNRITVSLMSKQKKHSKQYWILKIKKKKNDCK